MIGCPLETQYLQGFQGLHKENRAIRQKLTSHLLTWQVSICVDWCSFPSPSTLEREVFCPKVKEAVVANYATTAFNYFHENDRSRNLPRKRFRLLPQGPASILRTYLKKERSSRRLNTTKTSATSNITQQVVVGKLFQPRTL